jgi:hypothetical protein
VRGRGATSGRGAKHKLPKFALKHTSARLPLCPRTGKVQYPTHFEAYVAMKNGAAASREPEYMWGVYECWFCEFHHFGHKADKSRIEGHIENRRRASE